MPKIYLNKFVIGSIFFFTFSICANTVLTICPMATWSSNQTTVAGSADGAAGSSTDLLLHPSNLYIDDSDNLYILDNGNMRVQRWSPGASEGTTVISSSGGQDIDQFSTMDSMIIDIRGNIYVLDGGNARVTKWPSGSIVGSVVAGGNHKGNGANQLDGPSEMFVERDTLPTIWIADTNNHRIVKWTSPSTSVIVCGSYGSQADQFYYPVGLFVDVSALNTLYVADTYNHRIQMWLPGATNGITVAGQTGIYGDGLNQFQYPTIVAVDNNKIMYISDRGNLRIMKWILGSSSGVIIASFPAFGTELYGSPFPLALAFDSAGSLFVSDNMHNRIQKLQVFCPDITSTSTLTSGASITNTTTTRTSTASIHFDFKFLFIILCISNMYNNN